MSQNSQAHFQNLTAFYARFLKPVWSLWDVIDESVKLVKTWETTNAFLSTINSYSAFLYRLVLPFERQKRWMSRYQWIFQAWATQYFVSPNEVDSLQYLNWK